MKKKSISIFFYLLFLLSPYANGLKRLDIENKHSKYNQNNFVNEEERLINYKNPINYKNEEQHLKANLTKNKTVYLTIEGEGYGKKLPIGKNGIFYLLTNYNDNETNIFNFSDIEEKTKFETMFYDDKRSEIFQCRLWRPINDNLRIICRLNNFRLDQNRFKFQKVSLYYNEYIINIFPYDKYNYFYFDKKNYEIPFLYSDRQIIEIKDDIESYNLKFNIEIYNNELLCLYGEVNNSLILNNCQKNGKELNCEITKEKLEAILVKNNEQFRVGALHDNIGLVKLNGVLNITINYNIKVKEDIYIGITGSLTDESDLLVPFGFKTNITNISNIYSEIKDNCYFKKLNDNPLLFLCRLNETPVEPFKFGNITEEIVLNNLHYKYNFRIQPFEEIYNVNINGHGTNVNFILPEVLDFTSEDTLIITFIMPSPLNLSNIWLNPNSSSLECESLNEMKKCNISVSHFVNEESGDYYLYYSNRSRYYDLSPIKVILPNSLVEIPIEFKDNNKDIYIGDEGLLYFKTNYNDNKTNIFDISNIEEKTSFIATLNYNNLVSFRNINCRLWKPLNEKMWLFCKVNGSLGRGIDIIKIKDVVFHYKDYTIAVVFHCSNYEKFRINILNISVPLLYSDEQVIDIIEEINSYNLKFHIGLYNEQPLYLSIDEMKKIILQDCKENGKDLICTINKEKFYEIYTNSSQKLKLYSCDYLLKDIEFNAVHDINIHFDNIQKEDIFIGITKLLANKVFINTFTAYETNITNISDIISESFILPFKFDHNHNISCRIKKSIKAPLLIICVMPLNGSFYLEEIKKEIILDNINAKYNFRIQPVNNTDKCFVEDRMDCIKSSYPIVLNYYLSDTIYIDLDYYWQYYYRIPKITLNPGLAELTCYKLDSSTERCIVPKSHFDGRKDTYYFIHYFKYDKSLVVVYQLSPIKVILPEENDIIIRIKKEDNKDIIKIGQKGILYLKTNFVDTKKTFKETDIYFNSTIKDSNYNIKYDVKCKFLIPKNERLSLICELNENLIYNRQNISLNKVEFIYNDNNIVISQQDPLEVEQLDYEIAFLYSNQQNIEIKEGIETYKVKFYFEKYYDEILYMYGERDNSITFDKCDKNENELNCEISKEKIEEILIKNNEQFKVSAINDNIGIINFDFVPNITINYEIGEKEDIYVELKRLLTENVQQNVPITFETNVTKIPNIITNIFNSCYFKKSTDSRLLYLCHFRQSFQEYHFKIEHELIMNNSHYKYNFIIKPFTKPYNFYVFGYGTGINLASPELLNFTSKESLTIKFLASKPSLLYNLKLVPDSDNLACKTLNGLKKCIIPILHIIERERNYYYLNQTSDYLFSFLRHELSPIKVILPENIIRIYANDEEYGKKIILGKNNFFSLGTNYYDLNNIFDNSDIEEKIYFNTTIKSFCYFSNNYFFVNVSCRFWKPKNDNIRLLCKLNEGLGNSDNSIKMNPAIFSYKQYNIAIIITNSFNINDIQTRKNIPFLYSDKQVIKIEEDKQYYELKFKIEEYNNELLFLQSKDKKGDKEDKYLNEFILEDCNVEGKDLTCLIEKDNIIQNLHYFYEMFELYYFVSSIGPYKFSNVLNIEINYNFPPKEDVFVGITKLLQNNLDSMNYIPYETNITSISNVNTDFFSYETSNGLYSCKLKKSTKKPLLFLCFLKNNGTNSSLGTNTEVILNNLHIKYNFRIQPVNNSEIFTIKNEGSKILIRYPIKLDFTKNDLIPIYFIMSKPENIRGIKLNPDSKELDCGHPDEIVKRCLVPKSHFDGKKNGYYYTYYLNGENKLNIFYDISPNLVILQKEEESDESKTDDTKTDETKTDDSKKDNIKPDDSKKKNLAGIIAGSVVGGLVVIGIIVFFVVRYYKRKKISINDFSGKNENLFPNSTEVEFRD